MRYVLMILLASVSFPVSAGVLPLGDPHYFDQANQEIAEYQQQQINIQTENRLYELEHNQQ